MAAEPQRTYQPLVNGQNEDGSTKGNPDRDTVEGEKETEQVPQEQEQQPQALESQQEPRPRAPPPQLNWPRTQGGPRPFLSVPQQQQQQQQQQQLQLQQQHQQYQYGPQQPNNQQQFRGIAQQNFQNLIRRASPWSLLKAKIPGEQVQLQRGPEHAIYRMQNAPDPGGVNGGGPRPPSAGGMRMSQPGNLSRPPSQLSQEGGMPQMQQRSPYLQRVDSRTSMMGNPPSRPPSGMGMSGPPPMMRPIMRSSLEDDDDDVVISAGGSGSRPGSGLVRPPPGAPLQMRPNTPNRTPPQSPAPSQMPPSTRSPQPGRQPSLTSLTEHSETSVPSVTTSPATSTTIAPPAVSSPVTAPSLKPTPPPPLSRPEVSVPSSHTSPSPLTSSHSQPSTKTDTITKLGSLATTVTTSITTPTTTTTNAASSPPLAPSTQATAPSPPTNSVDASSKPPPVVVGAPPQPSKKMEERPPSVTVNEPVEEVKRPTDLGADKKAATDAPSHNDTSNQKETSKDAESKKETVVNGSHDSPKKSPSKAPVPNKLGKVHTPNKSPSKISPKTPETPGSIDKKKVPMNKIQVGAAPSPNLKSVRSKIGSLENAKHKPGGGNIKIETRKIQINAAPRIEAKNDAYTPGGGEKKIQTVKLHWEAKPKVGSLDNAAHKPGGGDKKIESVKLDFKDKAKPKVGSKDNLKHQPGGGTIKNAGESKEGSSIDTKYCSWIFELRPPSNHLATIREKKEGIGLILHPKSQIEDQKIEFKAESKVGSLENVKHRPGGGEVKIFDDKDYIRQMTGSNSDLHASSQGRRTRNSSTSRTRLSGSKSGTRENLSEDLSSPEKPYSTSGAANKPPLPTPPPPAGPTAKPMDQNSNQLSNAGSGQQKTSVVNGTNPNQPSPINNRPPSVNKDPPALPPAKS